MEEVKQFSASEISGWEEYFNTYGFMEERFDLWFAKLIQAVMNTMTDKKLKDFLQLNDFLPPYLQRDPIEISLDEQRRKAEAYHAKRHEIESRQKQ